MSRHFWNTVSERREVQSLAALTCVMFAKDRGFDGDDDDIYLVNVIY